MPEWVKIVIYISAFVFMIIIQKIMHSKRPVRSAVLSMFWGIAALIGVNLCAGFTGVSIPISPLTLSSSAFLGIPGVTCLLLLQRIL